MAYKWQKATLSLSYIQHSTEHGTAQWQRTEQNLKSMSQIRKTTLGTATVEPTFMHTGHIVRIHHTRNEASAVYACACTLHTNIISNGRKKNRIMDYEKKERNAPHRTLPYSTILIFIFLLFFFFLVFLWYVWHANEYECTCLSRVGQRLDKSYIPTQIIIIILCVRLILPSILFHRRDYASVCTFAFSAFPLHFTFNFFFSLPQPVIVACFVSSRWTWCRHTHTKNE